MPRPAPVTKATRPILSIRVFKRAPPLDWRPMDAYLAIVSKREVRDYADRPIEPDTRRRILEAGRVSGSSANKQPWRFIVVESEDKREQLADLVYAPGNVRD